MVLSIDTSSEGSAAVEEPASEERSELPPATDGACNLFLTDTEARPLPADPIELLRAVIQWGFGVAREVSPGAVPIHLPPEYCPAFEAYID